MQLQMWDRTGGSNQKWCQRIQWDPQRHIRWFQLVNINAGKCMDQEFNLNA